ncbi:MAG: DNA methyltransferase, partial [Candidatus Omnitrophica bacterium]|nr:DNA methyltransferase [Candidatus Omnitrophota bacterium]
MNNQPKRDNIKKILTVYLKEIHKIFTDGNFREESFYPSLKNLFEQCAQFIGNPAGVLVQPKRTDVGIPDFLIEKDGEIIGYIEAKTPDTNLRDIEDFEQIKRYQTSLPNLILTNFLEFRLYRNGEPVDNVEMGRQFTLQVLKFPPTPENLESFLEFLTKFFSFSMPEIKNSSNLSTELAKRTRFLEHILTEEISKGNDEVLKFYNAFKTELIETLTTERFSDLYAQTITY